MGIKEAIAYMSREVARAARALGIRGARKVDKPARADVRGVAARTPGRTSTGQRLASAARS